MSRRKVSKTGDYTINTQKELSDQYTLAVVLTGTVTVVTTTTDPDDIEGGTVTIISSDGRTRIYTFQPDAASGNPTQGSGNVINVRCGGDSTAAAIAGRLKDAIKHPIGHDGILSVEKRYNVLIITESAPSGAKGPASITLDIGDYLARVDFTESTPGSGPIQAPFILGEYGFLRRRG